jgi:hypothetical protein
VSSPGIGAYNWVGLFGAPSLLKAGILSCVGKSADCLVGQPWGESAWGFFLLSLVLRTICYKRALWRGLTRWLICKQYLVSSVHRAGCSWNLW